MKKSLALLLTLMMCISVFAGMSASAFSDVEEGHRHTQAITYLTEKGVINGYEDGTFKPENTITRAEFVKMLLEFLGFSNIYGDSMVKTGFSDVDGTEKTVTTKDEEGKETTTTTIENRSWAAGYIKLAVDKGVVNGYGDGTFKPDDPVTYEQAIKMIVCCLGREEHAKTRAENLKMPLWPDGYLSIGNDLMVAKSSDYVLGENATRSNIAQMLYNVKDVQIYVAPTINIGGVTASSGGVSVGGGGGGSSSSSSGTSTTVVSNLYVTGRVVAAVYDPSGSKKQIVIDDGIVIDNQLVDSVANKYIILKLDSPIDDNNYEQFYTSGNDFSRYLGHNVKLKYRYNPDGGVSGRYEIESVTIRETETVSINSQNFKREKTAQKNQAGGELYICYTDGDNDYYQPLHTDDIDSLKIIYNNKVVDVEELRDVYLANNPSYEGAREDIEIMSIDDLMPYSGDLKIVDADEDNDIDLIWVNSKETYVVGGRNFNATPKSITDKFRTTDENTALSLILNDDDAQANLNVQQNGSEIQVTAISANTILTVAQSKCGKDMDITVERPSTVSGVLRSVKTENSVKASFTMSNNNTYKLSDYFVNYVDSTLEYENGDTLTLYLDSKNEVIWATVAEVSYSTGYLISAAYSETTEELSLDILTSSGAITRYTMSPTRTRYITKATDCLSAITPDALNPNGNVYKNLRETLILESLRENAATINEGKPSAITVNAETAQPIMYTIASGKEIYTLVTLEPDETNKFTGEKLQFEKLSTGEFNFSNESNGFSAATNAMFVFVPNDRRAYDKTGYKIGAASSLSAKLIEYMHYNVEPFYTTDSSGTRKRTMFVVYNQNLDAVPGYRSENIIVTAIDETLGSSGTIWKLKGYVASNSTTKTYTLANRYSYENGYVLDENFNRITENGEYVRRTVEVGDVVRVGYYPGGEVAGIDIIFDVSADRKAEAPRADAVSIQGEQLDTLNPNKLLVYYYARIGEVAEIDSADVPEWCNIVLNNGTTSRVTLGTSFSTRQIVLYDHTETNENDRIKKVTMGDLFGGEMLYVWQGQNLAFKQFYAVRYPATQGTPEPEPDTGTEQEPETDAETEQESGTESNTDLSTETPADSEDEGITTP